jgi:hypothetical protein
MEVREGLFCLKLHESTTRYLNPEELLIPMFRQVTGSMFALAQHYEGFWKAKKDGRRITKRDFFCKNPIPIEVGIDEITTHFKSGFSHSKKLIKKILPDDIMGEVSNVMQGNVNYDETLWAKTVYNFAAYYKNVTEAQQAYDTLNALKSLWLGRFIGYVHETKEMDLNEAESVIQRQAGVFEDKRDYLLSIY